MTPTARTLALLRRAGFIAAPVERWIPGANVSRDWTVLSEAEAFAQLDRLEREEATPR